VVAEFDGELIVESYAVRHRNDASYGTHFLKIPGGVASESKGTHLDGCQHVARCVTRARARGEGGRIQNKNIIGIMVIK